MSKRIALLGLRLALVAATFTLGTEAAYAGPGGGTYYANSPPLRKFVNGLAPLGCNSELGLPPNNLGQCIPIAKPDSTTYPGSDYYEIAVRDFTERMHTDLPKATKLRGYVQINNGTIPGGTTTADNTVVPDAQHYLGPVILAKRGRPVRLKFVNQLGLGAAGNLFVPVDQTLMGTNVGPNSFTWNGTAFVPTADTTLFTENRAVIHLHGGFSPWISDGTPHQWITPAGDPTPYKKGASTINVPDMTDPAGTVQGEQTYYYTNEQSARLMFYHDHALGITRLNVYAGEAAGYLLRDDLEVAMEAAGVLPALQYNLPLVIQDKTFVPTDVAIQDALWDTVKWGAPGDLWFPHVYETNQDPTQPGGMSATGRWDYGPWFWPPALVTNPPLFGGLVANLPQPSSVPEAFMDTMLVNGTAYPTVTLEPRRYRLRLLNACNDRTLNLQLYQADPSYAVGTPGYLSEVKMIPPPQPIPRIGGIPDPALVGPPWINIGTEGGFMPVPDVSNDPALKQLWIGYDLDPRSITINNVKDVNLFLGPAQRADVIVDLSLFAGKTLILYNDSPAPVPAGDARVDYYTNNPDLSASGGNVSTLPGFGPNTRTIMQINVGAPLATPDPETFATTLAKLSDPASPTGLAKAFAAGQDPLVVQPSVPPFQVTNFTTYTSDVNGNQIPIHKKSIQELFDPDYGRMNSLLGTENQWVVNAVGANTNFQYYADLPTEILPDGQTQVWMVVHNGVDTHFIHFHLVNVQVVGRVDWAGVVKAPFSDEQGWRETVRMDPLEQTIVALKSAIPPVPWTIPDSIRPLDPTKPATGILGSAYAAATNPNPLYNYHWEYVWHCHLLGHEENDMMRPLVFQVAKAVPVDLTPVNLAGVVATAVPTLPGISLTWSVIQASPTAPLSSVVVQDEIAFRIERQTVGSTTWDLLGRVQYIHNFPTTFFPNGQTPWPAPGYDDKTAAAGVSYQYRVTPFNSMGDGVPLLSPLVALALPAPATSVVLTASKASPSPFTVPVVFLATATGGANYQYRFWLSTDSGTTWTMVQDYGAVATWTLPSTYLAGTYTVQADVRTSAAVTVDTSARLTHVISHVPATGVTVTPSLPSSQQPGTAVTFTAQGTGSTNYQYKFWLYDGVAWTMVQDYGVGTSWTMPGTTPVGNYLIAVDVRTSISVAKDATSAFLPYFIGVGPATGVTLFPSVLSPQVPGTSVTFTAVATGSSNYQYRFWQWNGSAWAIVQAYSATATWTWTNPTVGDYQFAVEVRTTNAVARDVISPVISYKIAAVPATGVTLTPSVPSPQLPGTTVVFTAAGVGSGGYDYRFWLNNGSTWTLVQNYGGGATWTFANAGAGSYQVAVETRTSTAVSRDAITVIPYVVTVPPATGVTLTSSLASPQLPGTAITFTAAGQGSQLYDYRFWLHDGNTWTMVQNWGGGATWLWTNPTIGIWSVAVEVRTTNIVPRDAISSILQMVIAPAPAASVTIAPDLASPHSLASATPVVFTATALGSSGYSYKFWVWNGAYWAVVQDWSTLGTWTMPANMPVGAYQLAVEVRTSTTVYRDAISPVISYDVVP